MLIEVNDDLSGNLKKLYNRLCKGERDEKTVDKDKAKEDAKKLYEKGEGKLGTDNDFFIEIFTSRSRKHLKLVALAYADYSGHSLVKAVEKETSGAFREALLTISKRFSKWF